MKDQLNELEQLRQIKEREKISYEKLAHEIGVSFRTLYRWLNGDSNPSDMGLRVIREFLKKASGQEVNHGSL